MGFRINTNISSLNVLRTLGTNDANMSRSLERLSSGYRINAAKDDAAGLAQAKTLNNQNRALAVASRNVSQANAMLQTAEGGADQIQNMLLRLKELATQAASQNSNSNLSDIDQEAGAIIEEIDRIANSTTYLGQALLTGYGEKSVAGVPTLVDNVYGFDVSGAAAGTFTLAWDGVDNTMTMSSGGLSQTVDVAQEAQTINFSTFGIKFKTTAAFTFANAAAMAGDLVVAGDDATFQVGQSNGENFRISFTIDSLKTDALSVDGVSLATLTGAQAAMDSIDDAIDQVSSGRANIGAIQNRLDYTYANIMTSIENLSAAESAIRDVDMAAEMTNFTKNQILLQAGTAMLAQANQAPQMVLQLLGR